jgi:Fe-S-cluster containining protein
MGMDPDGYGGCHDKIEGIDEGVLCRIDLLRSLQESFECRRCGECCRQKSIAFTESDVQRTSRRLNITPAEFKEKYDLILVDNPGDLAYYRLFTGDAEICPFNSDRSCTIYDARPQVCRGFPFLTPENVHNAFQMNNEISLCGKCISAAELVAGIFNNVSTRFE